jgi:hypothetical protein
MSIPDETIQDLLVPASNPALMVAVKLALDEQTFDKFFLFPELPFELRRMI